MAERKVMCEAWADLHLRNGDVVPMFLQGWELQPGKTPDDMSDYLASEMVVPLFTGQHVRQDNQEIHYWGPEVTMNVPDSEYYLVRVVRRADIVQAVLRYELKEDSAQTKVGRNDE